MPDYQPNPVVRAVAVIALVAALILVVAVVATSGGGSDNGDNGSAQEKTSNKRTERALSRGVWIVRSGDTLGKISQQTGIDVDTLIQLNPDLDPHVLLEGQRIALR
jgi:LysM repeat protein